MESKESKEGEPNFSPDETPERHTSEQEGLGYDQQVEAKPQQSESDANYSEQNDVTPPIPHEFPAEGAHTKANFESRPHGRTTGRMVSGEPGTEGI